MKRIDIRAPQDGIVHQLAVHTVGGVVSAGEQMMLVVPVADTLYVKAKISPQDIDQILTLYCVQPTDNPGTQWRGEPDLA